MRRVRLVGIGSGHPDQLTAEAVRALRGADFVIAADKGADDPLLAVRAALLEAYDGPPVVAVADPPRYRDDPTDYGRAVSDWHEARTAAYEQVLLDHEGDAVFLVWGDPALYDSTIRIVEQVHARGNVDFDWDVLPGISSVQLLAARHRIVLHEVGKPVVVTTARRLQEAVETGADNVVVMLGADPALDGLDDWWIWWGANLGTPGEQLVSGRVGDVRADIRGHRERLRAERRWVMDTYLIRRLPAGDTA